MVPSSFVRWAGIASLAAAGLILVHQISQLVFALTMSQSMAIATHSLRNGLALVKSMIEIHGGRLRLGRFV